MMSREEQPLPKIYIDGKEIEKVQELKYLGSIITNRINQTQISNVELYIYAKTAN